MKVLAEDRLDQVRTLTSSELVGELLDLELGERGISVLEITPEMVFERTGIARGHLLFAQANSLAVAMIDAEQALTGSAKIAFKRPVLQGEKVVAKGIVKTKRDNRFYIKVHSRVDREVVFTASFVVFVINSEGGIPVENNG
jgi:acyl-coenzyme A thioesterase PaaI-like protein